mmetsp:Transcript_5488/g.10880  ORF Transcript_5488/g.10880 Transcript_5488/m.10880 type:complete len:569 (-) Transcript_5488:37-1743(-)
MSDLSDKSALMAMIKQRDADHAKTKGKLEKAEAGYIRVVKELRSLEAEKKSLVGFLESYELVEPEKPLKLQEATKKLEGVFSSVHKERTSFESFVRLVLPNEPVVDDSFGPQSSRLDVSRLGTVALEDLRVRWQETEERKSLDLGALQAAMRDAAQAFETREQSLSSQLAQWKSRAEDLQQQVETVTREKTQLLLASLQDQRDGVFKPFHAGHLGRGASALQQSAEGSPLSDADETGKKAARFSADTVDREMQTETETGSGGEGGSSSPSPRPFVSHVAVQVSLSSAAQPPPPPQSASSPSESPRSPTPFGHPRAPASEGPGERDEFEADMRNLTQHGRQAAESWAHYMHKMAGLNDGGSPTAAEAHAVSPSAAGDGSGQAGPSSPAEFENGDRATDTGGAVQKSDERWEREIEALRAEVKRSQAELVQREGELQARIEELLRQMRGLEEDQFGENAIAVLASQQAGREGEVARLREEVAALQTRVADSDRFLQLQEEQSQMLKARIRELEGSHHRQGVNVDYLKNIVVSYMGFVLKRDHQGAQQLANVIATVLQFDANEKKRLKIVA